MNLILVPVDGSESGERAVRRAAERALEMGADVVVLHVLPTTFDRERRSSQLHASSDDVEEAFAQDAVDRALTMLAERGVRARSKIARGAPAQAIIDEVNALSPALVVMGSRGREHLLPEGSVSARVRSASGAAVEVVD